MKIGIERKQFDFEELKNGLLIVYYRPFSSSYSKKVYFTLFEQHTLWYNLAFSCKKDKPYWVDMNYLAEFIENHHGQTITCI